MSQLHFMTPLDSPIVMIDFLTQLPTQNLQIQPLSLHQFEHMVGTRVGH